MTRFRGEENLNKLSFGWMRKLRAFYLSLNKSGDKNINLK